MPVTSSSVGERGQVAEQHERLVERRVRRRTGRSSRRAPPGRRRARGRRRGGGRSRAPRPARRTPAPRRRRRRARSAGTPRRCASASVYHSQLGRGPVRSSTMRSTCTSRAAYPSHSSPDGSRQTFLLQRELRPADGSRRACLSSIVHDRKRALGCRDPLHRARRAPRRVRHHRARARAGSSCASGRASHSTAARSRRASGRSRTPRSWSVPHAASDPRGACQLVEVPSIAMVPACRIATVPDRLGRLRHQRLAGDTRFASLLGRLVAPPRLLEPVSHGVEGVADAVGEAVEPSGGRRSGATRERERDRVHRPRHRSTCRRRATIRCCVR